MTLAERSYFLWLYRRVDSDKGYFNLCRYLHGQEFNVVVTMDSNRIGDALREREIFTDTIDHSLRPNEVNELMARPVSIFEVLVSIAIRIDFLMDDLISPPRIDEWFYELLKNLELDQLTDNHWSGSRRQIEEIDEIIRIFMYRDYGDDGKGSLFPMAPKTIIGWPGVELWYQMNQWLAAK